MAMVKEFYQVVSGVSEADLELVRQLCLPYKVICQNFSLSEGALNMRVKRLLGKFGVENQRSLIVRVIQLGLLPAESFAYREFDG